MNAQHTTLFHDQYRRDAIAKENKQPIDPAKEAEMLVQITRVFGTNTKRIAVVNQDDAKGLAAYQKAGFITIAMNGDRPVRLPEFVDEWIDDELPRANRIIVVSDDPAFGRLCRAAQKTNRETMVWLPSPNTKVPEQLSNHPTQYLANLIPEIKVKTVVGLVDYENIHYSARDCGWDNHPHKMIPAFKAAMADLGNIIGLEAHADWDLLSKNSKFSYQRELAQMGVEPHYQTNIKGKNSADMRIVKRVHTLLEGPNAPDVIVIFTGDGDFRPCLESIRACGKKAVIVGVKKSMSKLLQTAASECRFLDQCLAPQQAEPSQPRPPQLKADARSAVLLRLLVWLKKHNWRFGRYDGLISALALSEAEVRALHDAIAVGMLTRSAETTPDSNGSPLSDRIEPNHTHPTTQAARHLVEWAPNELSVWLSRMPHVDSNFLFRGMSEHDKTFRRLGVGQTRDEAERWFRQAQAAGLITSRQMPHPTKPGLIITTWWPTSTEAAPPPPTPEPTPTEPSKPESTQTKPGTQAEKPADTDPGIRKATEIKSPSKPDWRTPA